MNRRMFEAHDRREPNGTEWMEWNCLGTTRKVTRGSGSIYCVRQVPGVRICTLIDR